MSPIKKLPNVIELRYVHQHSDFYLQTYGGLYPSSNIIQARVNSFDLLQIFHTHDVKRTTQYFSNPIFFNNLFTFSTAGFALPCRPTTVSLPECLAASSITFAFAAFASKGHSENTFFPFFNMAIGPFNGGRRAYSQQQGPHMGLREALQGTRMPGSQVADRML
jgi:hypothetical protein